jgi:hypothetical protein
MRIVASILTLVLLLAPAAAAQELQAGGSYTLLSLSYPDQMPQGFGGWASWDFVDASADPSLVVGLDGALNVFPEDHPIIGRQVQLLAGVRGGLRTDRYRALGRVRPGIVKFGERFIAPDTVCIAIFPTPEECLADERNFAVDVGVTFEWLATRRAVLRVDLGDTVIRFNREARDAFWTNNLQFSAGAGWRF